MEKIISEAMLASAIAETNPVSDSVDYYLPILQRYGYTMADFRHTVYTMSTRKSNPLNEIFGRVALGFDSVALVAEYRYNMAMRYDTLVMSYYSDTIYRKDTTIKGSLSRYAIRLTDIKAGTYVVNMDYLTMQEYKFPTKALTYRNGTKGVRRLASPTRAWLNRVSSITPFNTRINIDQPTDSLIIAFYDPPLNKEHRNLGLKDTSFVSNISVVYIPEMKQARKAYYMRYFDSIKFYQIIKNEKDSLPIHFRPSK